MRISIALNLLLLPAWVLSQQPSPSAPSNHCAHNPKEVSKYASRANCLQTEHRFDTIARWDVKSSKSTRSQQPVEGKGKLRRALPIPKTQPVGSLWKRLVGLASTSEQLEKRQQAAPPQPTDEEEGDEDNDAPEGPEEGEEDIDNDNDNDNDGDDDDDDDDGDDLPSQTATPTPTPTRSTSVEATSTVVATTSSSSSSSSSSISTASTLSTRTSTTESSTPSATSEPEDDGDKDTTGIAVGSVLGGLVMIGLVFLGIVYYRRWHNYRQRENQERMNRLQGNSPDDGGLPMSEASDQRTGLIQQPTPSTTAYNSGNSSDPSSSPENSYRDSHYNGYERSYPGEDVVMSGTAPQQRNSHLYGHPDTMADTTAAEMHLPTQDATLPQDPHMSYPAAAVAPYGGPPPPSQHPNRLSGPPMMTMNQPNPMLCSVVEAPEDNGVTGATHVTQPDNNYANRRASRDIRRKSLSSGAAHFDSSGDSSSGDSPAYGNNGFPGATPAYYGTYQQVPSGPMDQQPGMQAVNF